MKEQTAFPSVLRDAGSRVTPGRIALLQTLEKEREPLSARRIFKLLKGKVDQATVYRALEALADTGVIRRVDLAHPHTHYELLVGRMHHHHLVCKACGMIEDVEECTTEELEETVLKSSKFFDSIQSHSLEFFGVCKTCRGNLSPSS